MAILAHTYPEKPKAIEYERPFLLTLISLTLGSWGLGTISNGVFLVTLGISGAKALPSFLYPYFGEYFFQVWGAIVGIGIILILVGLLVFIIGYGLWYLRSWAWIVTVIFLGLCILISLLGLVILWPFIWSSWVMFAAALHIFIMSTIYLIYMFSIKHLFK